VKTSQRTGIKSVIKDDVVPVDWSSVEGGSDQ